MAREDLHFRLRIPEDLKIAVEAEAEKNRRSMTAEIVARLEGSFRPSSDAIVDAILGFREELVSRGLSVTLTGEKAELIATEAEKLNMTPHEYFNYLINWALDHLEKDTPLGKRLRQQLNE